MQTDPRKQHEWLRWLIGTWTYSGEATVHPDQPAMTFRGTEVVRPMGELWVIGESQGEMPDGDPATMIVTLGYDLRKERYVGAWVGSMMSQLWVYEGELDAGEKILTLGAEGPDMREEGKTTRYRDVIEMVSGDHRAQRSLALAPDGTWNEFMTSHYHRNR